jgi:hypothetical protein
MATEHHKLGREKGTARTGLSPVAQAIVRTSQRHFNPADYGDHAELLGVGGGDFHHPHAGEEVEYGK